MEEKLRLLAKESAELTYLSLLFAESLRNQHMFYNPDFTSLDELIDEHLVSTLKLFYKILPKMEEYNDKRQRATS